MQTKEELITIENLDEGEVSERVNAEIKKALENLMDKNTPTKKAREVTLKIKFIPQDDDREFFGMVAEVSSKLAPRSPIVTRGIVGKEIGGEIKAREILSGKREQMGLFDNVTPIRKERTDA
ncbi:MAG: hypothetical protein KKF30_07610 [Proteobacteria bacterium]|nr:hypothetical protein [Pseudomonadota bacterium]MBU4470265.1 hypothetical protein [Pseudomonadota bacterium]MCG2752679.1 hypothetical protein [Desulfobacteraceae bacterium]